jgi:CheY-like chemotaxis protein
MPGKKILIVDDDKFLLDMYSVKFRESGFEVTLCPSSMEALKKVQEGFSPDIILLDIVMPEMDGLELLRNLKKEEHAKNSCIIMLTNQSGTSEVEEAKKLGVDGYIVKASTIPSEVLEKVRECAAAKH